MTARIQKPLPARPCPPFTSPNRRANRPAEGFTLAPYWVYSDRDLYAREQAAIFRGKSWHYVGLEAEVPETGSYKTSYVGELPVVLTRAEDGSLHVLLKRCAHRGNMVCREAFGKSRKRYCVYHAWNTASRAT